MHEQRVAQAKMKMRCARHGLVATSNGACPSCEARAHSRARMVKVSLLVALALAAVIPLWRHFTRLDCGSATVESPSHLASPEEDRVRLEIGGEAPGGSPSTRGPSHGTTHGVGQDSVPDEPHGEEDRYLNRPIMRPLSRRFAPPSPPRASVDPEPRVPDDPRDFDLPR